MFNWDPKQIHTETSWKWGEIDQFIEFFKDKSDGVDDQKEIQEALKIGGMKGFAMLSKTLKNRKSSSLKRVMECVLADLWV